MVMGRCHAAHGASAGLGLTNLAGACGAHVDLAVALVIGGLGAGAAIAPDLDHEGATASRSLGPITAGASLGIRKLSAFTYRHTQTKADRSNKSGHRGITHTGPGAVAIGAFFGGTIAIAGAFSHAAGTWAAVAVIWLFFTWALRALPPNHSHKRDYITATVLTFAGWWILRTHYAGIIPVLLGSVIAIGCYVHAIGDGLTDYGSPLIWPFTWKGQRWYPCGMPRFLRFKAGKKVENRLVYPLSLVLAVVLAAWFIPGVGLLVERAIDRMAGH
jgi:hypothetical protein